MCNNLSNGWTYIKLNEILKMSKGKNPSKLIAENEDGFVPYVDIKAFEKGIVANYTKDEKCLFCEDGDILIVCDGSRSGLVGRAIKGAVGSTLAKISIDGVKNDFLYYFLLGKYQKLNTNVKGTGTPHVNPQLLKSFDFPIIPITEQERIVAKIEELFSELDKGVENLQTIKQQIKVYRQAVLKDSFELKPGWVQKKATDVGVINLGRQRTPKKKSKDYPIKYIRAANITEHGINTTDILEMEFTPKEQEIYRLSKDDIILSEASGSPRQVGKPAMWNCEIDNCCFQNTVIRHRVKDELPKYIYWYYMYCYNCGLFSQMVGGVGINHLGAKNFSELVINLAPKAIQLQIVNDIETRLSVCDKTEQTVDETLLKTESLRQSILKNAFEGKLA